MSHKWKLKQEVKMTDFRGTNGEEIAFGKPLPSRILGCHLDPPIQYAVTFIFLGGFDYLKSWWDEINKDEKRFIEYPLHAFLLVTESDIEALDFIMTSYNDLHYLSRDLCNIFLFYNGVSLDKKNREFVQKYDGKITISRDLIKRTNAKQAYIIAAHFGIAYDSLPCILFFDDLNRKVEDLVTFSFKQKEAGEIVDELRKIFTWLRNRRIKYQIYINTLNSIRENIKERKELREKMGRLEIPLHSAKLIRQNIIGGSFPNDKDNILIKDETKAKERMRIYIDRLNANEPCRPRFILPPEIVKPYESFLISKEKEQESKWSSLKNELENLQAKCEELRKELKKQRTPLRILKSYHTKQSGIKFLQSFGNVAKEFVSEVIAKIITNYT